MKVVGQPQSYSDMLERVFVLTLVTGIGCTYILATAWPAANALLHSVSLKGEIGPVKEIPVLYLLPALGVAFIARVFRLHDKISDLLRIRLYFDTHHILFPMASLAGITLDHPMKKRIRCKRDEAMYRVFYPYAGFAHPRIDAQLVRTALDNWGWFWVLVEAEFLVALTAVATWRLHGLTQLCICVCASLLIALLLMVQWSACRRSAEREVRAILDDPGRKADVAARLAELAAS